MDPFPIDLFGLMGGIFVVGLIVPILTTILIVAVIVWAIRRGMPRREDPAIEQLKARMARGEISPVEYEVRMRALRDAER
jgi:uncharacterized membrane protein